MTWFCSLSHAAKGTITMKSTTVMALFILKKLRFISLCSRFLLLLYPTNNESNRFISQEERNLQPAWTTS